MKVPPIILLSLFFYCLQTFLVGTYSGILAADGDPQWAKSTTGGSNASNFQDLVYDSNGNIYSVGNINGTGIFDFGNGVTVSGSNSGGANTLIVKYNSEGVAQWAKSTNTGSNTAYFNSLSVDSSGNIYAAGYITGSGAYSFGNSVAVSGAYGAGTTMLIVKYNSEGVAQWAKTVVSASNSTYLYAIAVDSSANLYVTGYLTGTLPVDFGNSITVSGSYSSFNSLVVKYNSEGVAIWAKSTTSSPHNSVFTGMVLDSSNNIYTVGTIRTNGIYNFGNGVTATGGYASNSNSVIVKYNSEGVAMWAKSTTTASNISSFKNVSVDSFGNPYVSGAIYGTSQFDFGNGVTATGGYASNSNSVIVKYNSEGVAQWAKSVTGPNLSSYESLSVDSAGSIYAVGGIYGGTYDFGNNVVLIGENSTWNVAFVKYSSDGAPQWAKTVSGGQNQSLLRNVAIDNNNNITINGYITSTNNFSLGNSVIVPGGYSGNNTFIAKYSGVPIIITPTSSMSGPEIYQIPESSGGNDFGGALLPTRDSNTGFQQVTAIIEPKTFPFSAFLSSNLTPPPDGAIARVITSSGTSWQVGNIQEIWYKAYPPKNTTNSPVNIAQSLQQKPSIISLSYKDTDLIPPGDLKHPFNQKTLKLAYSSDGRKWKILPSSVVDTKNKTVSAIDKLGGYYMIVGSSANISSTRPKETKAIESPTTEVTQQPTPEPTTSVMKTPTAKQKRCIFFICW